MRPAAEEQPQALRRACLHERAQHTEGQALRVESLIDSVDCHREPSAGVFPQQVGWRVRGHACVLSAASTWALVRPRACTPVAMLASSGRVSAMTLSAGTIRR